MKDNYFFNDGHFFSPLTIYLFITKIVSLYSYWYRPKK